MDAGCPSPSSMAVCAGLTDGTYQTNHFTVYAAGSDGTCRAVPSMDSMAVHAGLTDGSYQTNHFSVCAAGSDGTCRVDPRTPTAAVPASPDGTNTTSSGNMCDAGTEATNQTTNPATPSAEAPVLEFKDVTYAVRNKGGEKEILRSASGRATGGRMLAIMGGSGAGKTTLLDVLALRARRGRGYRLEGEVTLGGDSLTRRRFATCAAYVAQEPLLWGTLTTRETLEYAATLYGRGLSDAEREALVDSTLKKTGLASCADTIVGDLFRKGLSGGQKKRLTVAEALMKRPAMLVLDEPTSSLDSSSAYELTKLFYSLMQDSRMLLLCTIHQPSHRVFELFEDVLILCAGRVAYCGPTDNVQQHMVGLGAPELPPGHDIAEYLLELTNPDFTEPELIDRIVDAWKLAGVRSAEASGSSFWRGLLAPISQTVPLGALAQTAVLARRLAQITLRDPTLYAGRWLFAVLGNVLFSIVYIDDRKKDQDEVLPTLWLLSWAMGAVAVLSVVVIAVYFAEFHICQKERHNNMYRPLPYIASKLLVTVPAAFITSFCALLPVQAIVGLRWGGLPGIWLSVALVMLFSEFLAELLAVAMPHYLLGMASYIIVNFVCFLMAGTVSSLENIPWCVRWLAYANPWFHSLRSMVYFDFVGSIFEGFGEHGELCAPPPALCFGRSGLDVLDAVGEMRSSFKGDHHPWENLAMCFGIVVATKLLQVVFVLAKL